MKNIDNPLSEYQPPSKEALRNFGINISKEILNYFNVPNIQPDKIETTEFPEWTCQYNQEPIERGVENEKNT